MILDTMQNAAQYADVHAGIQKALEAMKAFTPQNYQTGRVVVDGDNVFLNVSAYKTHSTENAVFEAHQEYIDVMYMVEGEETIYVKPTSQLSAITTAYDPKIEALLAQFDDDATAVHLTAGSFIVLFPQDAHSPGCHWGDERSVKKIIGKVKLHP